MPATKSSVKRKVRKRSRPSRDAVVTERWSKFAWLVPVILLTATAGALNLNLSPKVTYPVVLTSAHLVSLFQHIQTAPVGEKIAFWSERLMKDPGLLSPLGRGPMINDTAPVFPRFYDCTTYVETVGGLARSASGHELADRIIAIRYREGNVSYETRNHFPEADWIPHNEAAGIVRDITLTVARQTGFVASFVNKDIDKRAWLKSQRSRRIVASQSNHTPVTAKIAYIPLEHVLKAAKNVPQGALINVVRENKERYPVLVSHQGFLVWRDGTAYLRHASVNHKITEVPLSQYVESMRKMPWKVLGFNVNAFSG